MHEIDLIPASYRRAQARRVFLQMFVAGATFLIVGTATARIWLNFAIGNVDTDIARLQTEQAISQQQRDELARLGEERRIYEQQLHLLSGLLSGVALTDLFVTIDETLIRDELWFRDWRFLRADVTSADGQPIQTGYFAIVEDEAGQNQPWQVETHMEISGQATDHAALSQFVTRLLDRPEIRNVSIRRTELRPFPSYKLVDFDLAVVVGSERIN